MSRFDIRQRAGVDFPPYRVSKCRCNYHLEAVANGKVFILDKDGAVSITNDAENVAAEIHERFPNNRIIYRDTMGNWDEILHVQGAFKGFAPARDLVPQPHQARQPASVEKRASSRPRVLRRADKR